MSRAVPPMVARDMRHAQRARDALKQIPIKELLPKICEKLGAALDDLRVYQVAFSRLGAPDEATRALVLKKVDALYPAAEETLNREL